MSVLLINAIVNKENTSELQNYLGQVMQVFGKNGGKPVARYKTVKPLAGEDSPEMVAVIEFPSAEVIEELVNGEDFTALADLRSRVFIKLNMMVCEAL